MRRSLTLLAVATLAGTLAFATPVASETGLPISTNKAPITPDGTTTGANTDFVVSFADLDPNVPGIDIAAGGTISLTLADGFVQDDPDAPMTLVVLQGWPQSPRRPFPDVTYDAATNTLMGKVSFDYGYQSSSSPGPKQLHAILTGFTNPGPGSYPVMLTIDPNNGAATMSGAGTVQILSKARPSINAISVINPPPPWPNSIYQTVDLVETPLRWGFYLWDNNSVPYVGVDLRQKNRNHYSMVDVRGRSVGQVTIDAPKGASGYSIDTPEGPSEKVDGVVLGIPTGLLIAQFHPDLTTPGDYTIRWRLNNGNEQHMFVTVNPD